MNSKEFIPLTLEDYIPNVVKRLYNKIDFENNDKIILLGFSDNMKWLNSLLRNHSKKVLLADWRENIIGYDCGGDEVISILEIENTEKNLVVVCNDDINEIKDAINYIIQQKLHKLNYLFDNDKGNDPFNFENPYRGIAKKAKNRAISMITDEQLFDLIQFIEQTKNIDGDVVEYGSLHGGSGAILAESVNYFCPNKNVWLFDTFKGIPKSKFGLDYHWTNSFMNNSFNEVSNAFRDLENVEVVRGDINETYNKINGNISFGYIASDTYESGVLLLEFLWPKLNKGGIIAICDYASYPNCYPLTVAVEKFFEKKNEDIFIFRPTRIGIFILKK